MHQHWIVIEELNCGRILLRELLNVVRCCVVFTTIQKSFLDKEKRKQPLLSDRRNIVVIADEAHRSKYDSFLDFSFQFC